MKLKDKTIEYIENVITTAQLVGLEVVVIEPDLVRGIDENRTVFVLHNKDVPDMEFGSIGLTRLSSFSSRLNIAKNVDGFNIEADIKEGDEETLDFARSLTMKGKGVKIEYRCADPAQLVGAHKAGPKQMRDEPEFGLEFGEDLADMLQKGIAAMKADEVSIISNDGVTFELLDVNSDVFSHQFADTVVNLLDEKNTKFAYRYPVKTVLCLLKNNDDSILTVSKKGIMCIKVNGLNVYIMPNV